MLEFSSRSSFRRKYFIFTENHKFATLGVAASNSLFDECTVNGASYSLPALVFAVVGTVKTRLIIHFRLSLFVSLLSFPERVMNEFFPGSDVKLAFALFEVSAVR